MKNRSWMCAWVGVLLFMGGGAMSAFAGAPPLTQRFLDAKLPDAPFFFESSDEGRIAIAADTTELTTNNMPAGLYNFSDKASYTGGNRSKGNYYRCDTSSVLYSQSIYLGRSSSAQVTFTVYESTTSNGVYTAIASNTVSAAVGTNDVSSGEMNAPLRAGRYYLMAASWDNPCTYSYLSAGYHPTATIFGESFHGFSASGYPPAHSVSNSYSSLLYFQKLVVSTNAVVRMDDSVNGSLVSTNSMDLFLAVNGYTNLTLEFRHRASSDEANDADGIFLSDDNGSTYTKVYSLDSGTTGWQNLKLDIAALAASHGVAMTNFAIRFQQADNYGWPSDGREFDDILVYSLPDLAANSLKSGGTSSASVLWRGFSADKQLPLELVVQSKGSKEAFSSSGIGFEYDLEDSGGTVRASSSSTLPWEIGSMETKLEMLTPTLTIPASTHLPDLHYTVRARVDASDDVTEALESNNEETMSLLVNHYSGWLWFNDIRTAITISSWGTRTADSPSEHWITGTGTLGGQPFAFTNLMVVKNLGTLDYSLDPAETTVTPVPFPGRYSVNGVYYWRDGGVRLSRHGAFADIKVLLPAGCGVCDAATGDRTLFDPTITFPDEKLSQALYPSSSATLSGAFKMAEETKPLTFDVSAITWNPDAGTFEFTASDATFVREYYYDLLEGASVVDPAMNSKRSNAAYYRSIAGIHSDPVVRPGSHREALMDVGLDFADGAFGPHFPYGPYIAWGGEFTADVQRDLLQLSIHPIDKFDGIDLYFSRNCAAATNCGATVADSVMKTEQNGEALLGPNGGIRVPVAMLSGSDTLEWGARKDGSFVQRVEGLPAEGVFYMPGTFLRGGQSAFRASKNEGPAEILLSGLASNGVDFERPGTTEYQEGEADYAGLNLRVGSNELAAKTTIGGASSDKWQPTSRSKYYLRRSGVSGIHEAVDGTFPSTMKIYGYDFGFSNFGLAYLSNTPKPGCSRINGDVAVPDPCNIDMQFENMNLCCLGDLEDADLANSDSKTLRYWDAEIQPQSLFFAPTAGSDCAKAERVLCMGLTTQCANFDQPLAGVLGFMPSGELGTPDDEIVGVPSRLSTPNEVEFDGPSSETYYFNPVAMPYYNNYGESGDTMSERGWINFAGNLDVAFFDDLQVHLQTSASTNSASASIYMMGGWSDGSKTFFNSDPDGFDTSNRGYPTALADYSNYRNPTSDAYRVHARRSWLNVVNFDYPLDWSSSAKSFKSPNTVTNDLLVLQVQHQTDYLSARNAEISFGMQYDGLPQINLANMAFNAIDEATGISSAFSDSVGDLMRDTIDAGVDAFSDTLSDLPSKLLDPVIDPILDPLIDNFYGELYSAYEAAPSGDYYSAVITNYIYGVGGSTTYQNVQYTLKHLDSNVYAATDLLKQINTNLDRAVSMIDAFTSVVTTDTNGIALPPASKVVGLLNLDSGNYGQLSLLGSGVLEKVANGLYNSVASIVEDELNKQLESAKPTLSSISQTLLDLREAITNVQAQLTVASNLGDELHDILNSPELQDSIDQINKAITDWFAALPANGDLFSEYSPEEVKAMIRQQIKDAFYGSLPCADIQQMVRSRLYELEASVEEAMDSTFQQLNKAMRDFVSQYVAQLDDKINGALGDLGDSVGAGQIDGYAHIRDDSLTELRLDGKFQWKVPKEMDFNAYLIIRQLDSKQAGACGMEGATLPEVSIGTENMEMDMLESKIRADISVKVAFLSTNNIIYPIGMGGHFNMKEGKIGFESFAITKLDASVAFGALENYLSAGVSCKFTDYEVQGGIFLGKTCTLDPFSWDEDVQSILGDPPFTGVYVYGQGWIPVPIVDYGCMLQIRVGVGAGIFAFLEGPVGGKVYMGLDGTALCLVNVGAEVTLVGLKDGNDLRMKGKGTIRGRAGACPFCVKFSKTIGVTYDNGDWGVDL